MSKKRNQRISTDTSTRHNQKSLLQIINQYPVIFKKSKPKLNSQFFQQRLSHLCQPYKRTFNTLNNLYQNQNAILTDSRQKLIHKNNYLFRQSINTNDTSILPFMTSLRSRQIQRKKSNSEKKPPNVAFKTTMNQKFMKSINDIEAQERRISQIYYRWHNKSGYSVKKSAEYECSLRNYHYKNLINPQTLFDNQIRPIKYKNVQQKVFKKQDLFCPKQIKLFKIK